MPITDRTVIDALRAQGQSLTDAHAYVRDVIATRHDLKVAQETLRDKFAGNALTGLLCAGSIRVSSCPAEAYDVADLMIASRGKVKMSRQVAMGRAWLEYWEQAGCMAGSPAELKHAIDTRTQEILDEHNGVDGGQA